MKVIIALIISFFIGFTFNVKGYSQIKALALASLIMPSFILLAEFILPHKGSGASMWPIALLFGAIYGTIVGGLGVIAGAFFLKWQVKNS
jgi:hypothetical protein